MIRTPMPRPNAKKPSPLSTISASELRRELAAREQQIRRLAQTRAKLAAKMAEIDRKLAMSGTEAAEGRPPRLRNEVKLVPALVAALKGKELSVGEAAQAVQEAGYLTSSPNFRVMVNQALLNKKLFARVDRGVYTAK